MANELYPSVGFRKDVLEASKEKELSVQSFTYTSSGNFTASSTGNLLGAIAHENGEIVDIVLSAGNQGRDNDNDLSLSADLKVNGSSVVDSSPTIMSAASGETAEAYVADKPTFTSPNVSRGDRLDLDLDLTRTASPDVEMQDLYATVKVLVTE